MSVKALKVQLQVAHSKENTNLIVQNIQAKNLNLNDVFSVIKQNEPLFSQRAAWIISTLSDQNNDLLKPYYHELISLVDAKYHDAVLRATFRTLSGMKIQEKDQGFIFDTSIKLLTRKHTAVAVKAWIIDVLMHIAIPYPELQNEILLSIKPQLLYSSSGLKGKILKTIQKISDNFEQA